MSLSKPLLLVLRAPNGIRTRDLKSKLESSNLELQKTLDLVRVNLASSMQKEISFNEEIVLMKQSISWRNTRPLRWLKSWIRK